MALTLGRARLAGLAADLRPRALPEQAGILHIGLGAFHRAHQAVFTEAAIAAAGGDWGIVAVAPRSPALVEALRGQDFLFSVTTRSGTTDETRVVGSIVDVRHLPTQPAEILGRLADPAIRVVTLTVTEKAYRLDDDVRADLTGDCPPRTVLGLLARGLRDRAAAGGPPLAIVSCDNLPGNGERLRAAVEAALDAPVGDWAAFPATMVDRIVPATTEATLARARAALGATDRAAVEAEPYTQWVIQDDFPAGRPAWDAAGAILTADVTSWERLKLRVLNGLHSTAAYLGALAGCATIADAVARPGMTEVLHRLAVDEIGPTLTPPPGVRIEEYVEQVLGRFGNRAIEHRTIQVAMDGSQKLPQRLLLTIADRRRQGAAPGLTALALAAWMRFVGGHADDGSPVPLDDPLAETIRTLSTSDDPVRSLLGLLGDGLSETEALADDDELVGAVEHWRRALTTHGAADTVLAAARLEPAYP